MVMSLLQSNLLKTPIMHCVYLVEILILFLGTYITTLNDKKESLCLPKTVPEPM